MLATMSYQPREYRGTTAMAAAPGYRPVRPGLSRQKLKSSHPQPLDADDLSRRLRIVLAEQKAHSDRKKKARAEAERRARHTAPSAGAVKEKSPNVSAQTSRTAEKYDGDKLHKSKLHLTASKTSSTSSQKDDHESHGPGHPYVPQVAAAQFARTTTVETLTEKHIVHKLSKKAMKFHLEGPNASREMGSVTAEAAPFEQAQAVRRAHHARERQYERNQFQHAPIMETATEADEVPPLLSQRRTFETHFKPEKDRAEKEARRRSTGSFLGKAEPALGPPCEVTSLLEHIEARQSDDVVGGPLEHQRVDWTQSDEARSRPIPVTSPPQPPPTLRKPDSKWTLRGRLGSFTKHSKDDKPPSSPDEKVGPLESPKSPVAGFFARFKR
ncbi:glutamate synthase [Purpureocillium lavendulum]|uniref:Glutamate synthase n=1 Tax=Purpureocillium lavendulum TaxID=1247861 RepID=A0AB34FMK1_9HYPO|nr:glutamate synthase [Purpureocillium lavendulum]